ncbi:GTP pyrophosphokinase [Anaerotruncus sp. 2789STDY5834896]|uniref:GTP diphosphokinase n=1 Tax=uncultured Anaerotruncus sp. TaxID=905011 RepID=A0A1C6I4X9_9FIRM|nr:GTP pyrophosphokinase [uncultured Anaerotruncus sp.]
MDIMRFEDLEKTLQESEKSYDLPLIEKAYHLADNAHAGQMRLSGEPYITHPLHVAALLVELGMDTDCIVAALLHDVIEDTDTPLEAVKKTFGEDVALLVDGVTKLGKIQFTTREDEQAENVRKMLLAMSQDIRVILIKLCDRLHNMRTLDAKPPQKQRDTSLETMEVYAPIAHRLGITTVKEELEDTALKYLDPFGYQQIQNYLAENKMDQEGFLQTITGRIRERLADYTDVIEISGRMKSVYGIYRKVFIAGKNFDEIYDIVAVRILCNTVNECYNILGLMHDLFRPIPNRFKDYISTPKPNMYQSLHTTVISKERMPFEIQIRTYEMHHTAEYGIAAHWKYKAGIRGGGSDKMDERLAWIRQLLEAQKESEDARDLIRSIKSDLAIEEVYAFTPKGDVKSLPKGSTVIDFAYAIHSGVGNAMVGAKVDGRIVSLDYQIQNGEIIEIITSKSPGRGPSRDWLKIVRTSEARNKIRNWFKKTQREENILEGKIEVEREFKRNQISADDKMLEELLAGTYKKYQLSSLDDFYAALGYGGISLTRLMPRIKEAYNKMVKPAEPVMQKQDVPITKPRRSSSGGVEVEGIDNCLIKFAKCCNPLPGDNIVGFITRGFGVSVHKSDCPNVLAAQNLEENSQRWVNVRWSASNQDSFKSTLEVVGLDRQGLFADISVALSAMRVPIYAINARSLGNGYAVVVITVGITNLEHLNSITARLKKIQGVESVERAKQ